MDTQVLISLVIGVIAIAAFFGTMFGIQRMVAKGGNPQKVLGAADTVVDGVKALNDSVGKLLIPAPAENIIDRVLQVAQSGVHQAQQLYNSGNLPPDLRKDQAVNYALNLLKLEGREITPELEAALRGAVEDAVYIMKFASPGSSGTQDSVQVTEPSPKVPPDTPAQDAPAV